MSDSVDLEAQSDLDALRLLVETAQANALPDDYEAQVTIGFMRGLLEQLRNAEDRANASDCVREKWEEKHAGLLEQLEAYQRAERPSG